MTILYSVLVMLGISLLLGVLIAVFAKYFEVEVDPRIKKIAELLPAYNCGACGYPGCDQYAEAVIEEGASESLCKPGGKDTIEEIKKVLAESKKKQNAESEK